MPPPTRASFRKGKLYRLQNRSIVRFAQLISDILRVSDVVVPIDHKDRTLEQAPLFEQHPVVLTELHTPPGGEHLVLHACALLPTSLHLWIIPAHGIDACMCRHVCAEGFPLSRHTLTDRIFQAVHHARAYAPSPLSQLARSCG